jgi:hypothetical protein
MKNLRDAGFKVVETKVRSYLFSVQCESVAFASAKEPEKIGHPPVDKRGRVIYPGGDDRDS